MIKVKQFIFKMNIFLLSLLIITLTFSHNKIALAGTIQTVTTDWQLVNNGQTIQITTPSNALGLVSAKIRWKGYKITQLVSRTATNTVAGNFSGWLNTQGSFPDVPAGGTFTSKDYSIYAVGQYGTAWGYSSDVYGFDISESRERWFGMSGGSTGYMQIFNNSWSQMPWNMPNPSMARVTLGTNDVSGNYTLYLNTRYTKMENIYSNNAKVHIAGSWITNCPNTVLQDTQITNYQDLTHFALGINDLNFNVQGSGKVYYQVEYTYEIQEPIVEPALHVINAEGKTYQVDKESGRFYDISDSMSQNFGSEKPFYTRDYSHKINGTRSSFYDFGTTITYLGNNVFRVVTSEGKAYNIVKNTGEYTEVTETFIKNNFGSGKPFYDRIYEQEFNGYGPFFFHDFGSTMAYIGNNKIRVVTSERKAFDVDKDTGEYVEVNNFLNNNWGSGKPFYLREYTHTIGGEAKTFYDWGSSMTYIGNNTLRVVTSEGKAFDVDKDTGAYTDITSTFLINNFGEGKPFYLRTYPVTINGTSYDFYDWGSTFAYTGEWNPTLTITSPPAQAAFDTITLTGTVSNKNNNDVMVTAAINGVAAQPVTLTGTATAKDWTLTWNIGANAVPEGTYSNIEVTATDMVTGEVSKETYTGTIFAFGPNSNMTKKTVVYEYDENGKLVRRKLAENS